MTWVPYTDFKEAIRGKESYVILLDFIAGGGCGEEIS